MGQVSNHSSVIEQLFQVANSNNQIQNIPPVIGSVDETETYWDGEKSLGHFTLTERPTLRRLSHRYSRGKSGATLDLFGVALDKTRAACNANASQHNWNLANEHAALGQ